MKRVGNSVSHRGLVSIMTALFITAGVVNALVAQAADSKRSAQPQTSAQTKQKPVDVNSADEKALETLPGIGPVLADRIIAGRPYQNLTDLGKIKGLSQSKLDVIKDNITFGPTTVATKETKKTKSAKEQKAINPTETAESKTPVSSSVETKPTGAQTPLTPTGSTAGKLVPGQRININTASAEELDALPGIGPVKAQAIIDYRSQHGGFKTIEDIENVKGIKAGEFSKIKDHITVTR